MLNLQEGFSLRIIETPASIESIPTLCVEGAMTSQMTWQAMMYCLIA